MNYFIFKGKNSSEFSDLVVNTLPPITKAAKRVQTDTVDGLDGEIITELGYEAYDKGITITLLKPDKIDEIMAWLNGEGDLVTSNEPDKVYKCKIISQIDFQTLYQMRTATITFRTQPYKYLYKEPKQVFVNPVGSIILVNNGLETSKPIVNIVGSGTIEFKIEDVTIFSYTFPEDETSVTIDSEKQDAYTGSILKNRNMTGEFPTLKVGKNNITWSGTILKIEVVPNSRWL